MRGHFLTTTTHQNVQAETVSVQERLLAALAVVFLGLSLTTPYVLGAVGAYLQIICAFLMLGIVAFQRDGLAVKGDPAFKLLLLAFALLAIAFTLTARQPGEAALSVNFAMLLLFGPMSRYLARFAAPANLQRIASFALAGSVIAFGVALYQVFVIHLSRADGWGTDPIWSAEAALVLGFLAGLGVGSGTRKWRMLYLLGPALGICVCLLSGSRGTLLAVPVLLLVALMFSTRWRWLIFGGAVVIVATAWLGLGVLWPAGFERINTTGTLLQDIINGRTIAEVSGGTRQAFYGASYAAFLHSPWIGYGWTGKMPAIVSYLAGDGAALIAPHLHLHSDLLDFGVSGGLIGLIAYGLILAAPIVAAVRGPRDSQFRLRLAGTAILASGYLVCGLTYLMFGYEFHSTLYVCLAAILIGYCRDKPPVAIAGRQ
jgi:O-antigen ligase